MLESVKALRNMSYQLFASLGTADYFNAHGIEVSI